LGDPGIAKGNVGVGQALESYDAAWKAKKQRLGVQTGKGKRPHKARLSSEKAAGEAEIQLPQTGATTKIRTTNLWEPSKMASEGFTQAGKKKEASRQREGALWQKGGKLSGRGSLRKNLNNKETKGIWQIGGTVDEKVWDRGS